MDIKYICDVVAEIKNQYGNSPLNVINKRNILFHQDQLGKLKGYCTKMYDTYVIILNDGLPKIMWNIILAHEIGHIFLHLDNKNTLTFTELTIFCDCSKFEKEANYFAAEYLLSDNDVLEAIQFYDTYTMAAANLSVPVEYLLYKLKILSAKGYNINFESFDNSADFLCKLQVCDEYGYLRE